MEINCEGLYEMLMSENSDDIKLAVGIIENINWDPVIGMVLESVSINRWAAFLSINQTINTVDEQYFGLDNFIIITAKLFEKYGISLVQTIIKARERINGS